MTAAITQSVRDFYDKNAASWDSSRQSPWPGWQAIWEQTKPKLANLLELKTLDLGSGNGRFANFLLANITSEQRVKYLGLEFSAELIKLAEKNLKSTQIAEITFQLQDLTRLPVRSS